MSAAVSPETFAAEFMNAPIAPDRPPVPAVEAIMPVPIIEPEPMGIWLPPVLPSIIPSDASFIMAVAMADENGMLSDLAYCDIAASVMP